MIKQQSLQRLTMWKKMPHFSIFDYFSIKAKLRIA